jgi:hypothetical protein
LPTYQTRIAFLLNCTKVINLFSTYCSSVQTFQSHFLMQMPHDSRPNRLSVSESLWKYEFESLTMESKELQWKIADVFWSVCICVWYQRPTNVSCDTQDEQRCRGNRLARLQCICIVSKIWICVCLQKGNITDYTGMLPALTHKVTCLPTSFSPPKSASFTVLSKRKNILYFNGVSRTNQTSSPLLIVLPVVVSYLRRTRHFQQKDGCLLGCCAV